MSEAIGGVERYMNYLSRAEVRAYDNRAIEQLGVPSIVLMENAGRGAASVLQSLGIAGQVVIACGKGNNGGDGLVIARHLANWGHAPRVLLFANPDELAVDCAIQWNIVQKMHLSTQVWPNEADLPALFAQTDWLVDALFGTGLTGPLREPFNRVVELMNASGTRTFAVDIPSGLDCDTGEPLGITVRAEHTATFVAPKLGYANPGSVAYTGKIHVVDIGVV